MTMVRSHMRRLAGILAAAALALSQAATAQEALPEDAGEAIQLAAADCYAIGEQVAAQYGGTLAKASASNRGGQTVCHIVVLVPGKDGQRPKRIQVDVPAG
jgi:hypothetical protein